jgi:hypothetical protein
MVYKGRHSIFITADGMSGRIIKSLPEVSLDGGRKEIPLILQPDPYVIDVYHINLQEEGVDEFGNVGKGDYIKRGYLKQYIGQKVDISYEDSFILIKCDFMGRPSWITLENEELYEAIKTRDSKIESYRVQLAKLREETYALRTERLSNVTDFREILEIQKGRVEVIKKKDEDKDENYGEERE